MRSLRERLNAVTSAKPQTPKPAPQPKAEPFFCRERIVPLCELGGIENTTLEEIRACDPDFAGRNWDMNRLLFLDTETTGLSGGAGTVAFEIGVGWINPTGMVIRQYVMRDYGEEAAMLQDIARLFERCDTVVSFNGKSFDLPLLETRMIMNRIPLRPTGYPQLDLLHIARRVYKLRLKKCNLTSLEEAVLGHERCDDLPGAQVPQRYFDYLKTKEFVLLEDVLRHNFDDVKSLAELTAHLCGVFRAPLMLSHPEDLFGVGRTLMRGGNKEQARACFKILGRSSLSAKAHMHLASSYKRDRQWEETTRTCTEMIARGEGGTWPYIELAKYYEHVKHDIPRALRYAQGALNVLLNQAAIRGDAPDERAAIIRRIGRLHAKQRKQEDGTYGIHR